MPKKLGIVLNPHECGFCMKRDVVWWSNWVSVENISSIVRLFIWQLCMRQEVTLDLLDCTREC